MDLIKITLCLISFAFVATNISAQTDSLATDTMDYVAPAEPAEPKTPAKAPNDKKPLKDKIYFGGNLGLSFGTVTSVAIEPMVGWKWTPKLSTGFIYSFWYFNDKRYIDEYKSSSHGIRIFNRYRIIPQAYAHVEYAMFWYDNLYDADLGTSGKQSVPYLFLGGGLSQPLGGRATLFAQILYDVIQDSRSIYRSNNDLYFTMGVGVGF